MYMRLFVKNNNACYSTGSQEGAVKKLSPLGFIYVGKISGRDISGYDGLKTMSKVLREARDGKV